MSVIFVVSTLPGLLNVTHNVCVKHSAAKVTCLTFLLCFGEGAGLVMLEEGGGLFSRAGLDGGNTLAVTGWFFFPGGSPVGSSAGRFIPAIPPTAANAQIRVWTGATGERGTKGRDATGHTDTHSGCVRGSSCNTARHTSGY